ncbi:MAG: class I SAM-dependent methyltransferase [Lachnospiraceae bacterium]|nr:class I SAM-dependent methyltransferase [Lachnospiraceae bacterium]
MNKTIDYYNQNATAYTNSTLDVEFALIQDRFLALLPEGAYILDFGCGSGRDTKYFLGKGYRVEAIDGSEELCKIASQNTGIEVRQCLFEDFTAEDEKYDGIWACSSILHLPKTSLLPVMKTLVQVVKKGGYLYTSFKYGEFEGERHGRHFTFFTEDSFCEFAKDIDGIEIVDMWTAADVRPGRENEQWLNIIARRKQ